MSLKALSEYTVYSKYAHYIPEKRRRETWEEIVERVFGMHAQKYEKELNESGFFKQEFEFAKQKVKDRKVLGSQRALQFGGEGILKKNAKIYNCTSTVIDRLRAFQEIGYLLLCGCGAGYSIQYHHTNKLPDLVKPSEEKIIYTPEDSIEGWAECWGILINSYFKAGTYKNYEGKTVEFDLSTIRPEGSLIAGQFKAPGPEPLRKSLEKIRKVLDLACERGGKLKPIEIHDIICHIADGIISGGVRRSALICLFDKNDKEMAAAKTGNWYYDNAQRARANNSVVLERGKISKEDFYKIFENIQSFGEPGFYFVDDGAIHQSTNPCKPEWAPMLTRQGIKKLKDVKVGEEVWSETGWTKMTKKWSTGVKEVYEYRTTAGVFYGTENHRVVSNGQKVEAKDAESMDRLVGGFSSNTQLDEKIIMDGLVFGDGGVHKASNNLVVLYVGKNDNDYFSSEVANLIKKHRPGIKDTAYEVETSISYGELPHTYSRKIPDRYFYGDRNTVCSFLRGLYSANGSLVGGRVTLKASSFDVISQAQMMLSSVGISSYYTTNKSTSTKFRNGDYTCKESYDLNITTHVDRFEKIIGFIQNYKQDKLRDYLNSKPTGGNRKKTYDIISTSLVSEEEVFDITVDNDPHTYWTGGANVSNCCEIGFWPVLENEDSGFGGCNLTEINGGACENLEDFLGAARAASFIGTMQAGYTNFPYLGKTTEEIFRREALLGVSITGWMDKPNVLFNKENLGAAINVVREENEKIAKIININPAARLTCTKPSGNASCLLMTGSGIHPQHAKRFLRRVQVNKKEFAGKVMKKRNPISSVESVWSANKSDSCISFPCQVEGDAIFKKELNGIKFLEKIKFAFENWVLPGTIKERGIDGRVTHNISCTVNINSADEWAKVRDYIFENRYLFSGISLLAGSGDLDYDQAPFVEVLNPKELVKKYGDGVPLASGLIVDGLHAFDNLWQACDAVLGGGAEIKDLGEPLEPKKPIKKHFKTNGKYAQAFADYTLKMYEYNKAYSEYESHYGKSDWVRRANQFAERYFKGDVKQMTYCLKHVSIWKDWLDITREWQDVDWSSIKESQQETVNADTLAATACAGGQCEVQL